jgi:hypothetical protein
VHSIHFYLSVFVLMTALFANNSVAMQSLSPQTNTANTATSWKNLNANQKQALGSLSLEWDSMDEVHQKKWLGIANKYSNMSAEEKIRVQERVNAWVNLTPKQRMDVRENFTKTSKITAEKKSEQWQQYQLLNDQEKKQFASQAKNKKSITNIQPESKKQDKTIAPIKKNIQQNSQVTVINSSPIQ